MAHLGLVFPVYHPQKPLVVEGSKGDVLGMHLLLPGPFMKSLPRRHSPACQSHGLFLPLAPWLVLLE